MKKLLILFCVSCLLFAFASCGNKTQKEDVVLKVENDLVQTENAVEEIENPLGFENINLMKAVCDALGKKTGELTEKDIESIKYFAIGPEGDGKYTVFVGLSDYMDSYFEAVNNPEDEFAASKLETLVKISPLEYNKGKDVFSDIAKFTQLNVFEYYDIPVSDVSFLNNLDELYFGYFKNNGITDVSSLEGYNPVTLRELDFTGNKISDWSYLEHIKEKVVVHYEVQVYNNSDGEKIEMPVIVTLEEKIKQDKQREEQKNSQSDSENKTPAFVDKDGKPVDFGSLFE